MGSARLPLSSQGGCCRSKEPTVWGQLIAGSVYTRRASCIDPANLLPTASGSAIASAILRQFRYCSAIGSLGSLSTIVRRTLDPCRRSRASYGGIRQVQYLLCLSPRSDQVRCDARLLREVWSPCR